MSGEEVRTEVAAEEEEEDTAAGETDLELELACLQEFEFAILKN